MTRRIKKQHLDLFEKYELTEAENKFILGCIRFQKEYPQLTQKQWRIVESIYERYKNQHESKSSQKTT